MAEEIRIEPGTCPKCGKNELEYGSDITEDQSIHCPYTCQSCGFSGEEVYSIEFAEHLSADGEEVFPA